jgi:ParB/RepB/Spo0J family partition protein
MDLEIRTLDLRYAALRAQSAVRERRLLAAMGDVGQQTPIIVVRDAEAWVVVDGYKRIRALSKLGEDTVRATSWELGEADALVLERVMRSRNADSALEEGWLLRELGTRFALSLDDLSRRFDRTRSWVSRRLSLVTELPASVQAHVRAGAIGAHAAMKHLVPLARANAGHCVRLADAIAPARPTSRQIAELYGAYTASNAAGREQVVSSPVVMLRARAETKREGAPERAPIDHLLVDMRAILAIARRAHARVARGAADGVSEAEREVLRRTCREAADEMSHLISRCDKEASRAG